MIFHADANSFYASCEQIFRPELAKRGVVVLSNNDSIIISLNKEAKLLGLERGQSYFEIKTTCDMYGVCVFSSNYTLYADISKRITSIYADYAPDVEQYSIDECFLFFPDWTKDGVRRAALEIREQVLLETGITVSIGIAPTKTLAKLCNGYAKKSGIFHFEDYNLDSVLDQTPAADIWGIGHSKARLLQSFGIHTALQLKQMPLAVAKKKLTITGFNTVRELNGIQTSDFVGSYMPDQDTGFEGGAVEGRRNMCSSRQFSRRVYKLTEIEAALCEYTVIAVRRMRKVMAFAQGVSVYLTTGRDFSPGAGFKRAYRQDLQIVDMDDMDIKQGYYSNYAFRRFGTASNYLPEIQSTALELLREIYRQGFGYKKVLVNLCGLSSGLLQTSLFDDAGTRERDKKIMMAFDRINEKFGSHTLYLGQRITEKTNTRMRRDFLSPRYTTNFKDLPII